MRKMVGTTDDAGAADERTRAAIDDATGRESPPPAPRSLANAAGSFATSMARFAASGFKTVDAPLHELRMAHCRPCEHRRNSQCALCRCFVDKKAWLPHEDCPIGRWPA